MQNPKTGGNRFNPDIRPSEIDTYTETNGEQTAEYKIINAHPIINGILNKLAFFRTHAAAVYYNRLANKTVKQKFDDVDAAVGELNENFALSHITPANFFESTEIVELIEMEVVKTGMAISLYARIKILSELINNRIGTIKEPYRPHLKEAVGSIRSVTAPYKEVGSIWFGDTGAVRIYGNEIQTQYYINATWLYLID